ncbi:MAG: ABC transporter substrate-binding protein [Geminicoccaceae bacterium]
MRIGLARRGLLAAAAAIVLGTGVPAQAADAPVKVGSKIDTEGSLLGNLMIKVLEANGIAVENKVQLGTTKIVREAILAGELDLYPEYTGNGAFFFGIDSEPVWKDASGAYDRVRDLDLAENRIVWLKPAPANNTWAIAVRQDLADANGLRTLDDFARWVNGGGDVKIAASAEFVESPAALPAFQQAYGFTLGQEQILTLAGGDTAVTIKAAAEQTSGVNTAMAYGTDGALAALGLVVLEDTKGAQAVYEPAPVVREAVLQAHPQIAQALDPVFASLDGPTLQELNAKIQIEGQDAGQVAGDYLKAKGFVR